MRHEVEAEAAEGLRHDGSQFRRVRRPQTEKVAGIQSDLAWYISRF